MAGHELWAMIREAMIMLVSTAVVGAIIINKSKEESRAEKQV